MLQRASSTSLLLLLAACQSTSGGPDPQAEWRSAIELSQTQLRHDVESLRSALAQRALQPAAQQPAALAGSGVGSSIESAGAVELTARLAALSDCVELLNATMSTTGPVRAAGAAYTSEAPASADVFPTAAIESLRDALTVLEQQRAMHCENIANVSVPGYKRRTLLLTSELHESSGLRLPQAAGMALDMAAGVLECTGGELDLGIHGAGFFETQLPNGEWRYTRNGSFRQDVSGHLVTAEGYLLSGQVLVPPGALGIAISDDGSVYAMDDQHNKKHIGTIRLHVFPNSAGLEPMGGNCFAATVSSGEPLARQAGVQGTGRLKQHYIERSNVELNTEMIDLQLVERRATAVRRVLASHGIYTR